jgi:predicted lysophospholipase L1 biosynthesis ABC-type transport system permease subunit
VPVVGITVSPDDVAFPLTPDARIYVTRAALARRFGADPRSPVNQALLWTHDPRQAPVTLAQARATSAGIGGLTFVTRSGVRVLIDGAGGIVIALLVAVSLVALAAAGTMLAASWRAEVQRRLPAVGVRRALGFGPGHVAALHGAEAALVAVPAAAAGLAIGALVAAGPSGRLLAALNELSPGAALLGPLTATWAAVVALVAAAAAWPAWRAAKRPPVALLRGGDAPARPGRGRGGLLGLGARLVAGRRARLVATVCVLGVSAGFVALLLALATLLDRLEHDPGSVGKRYQLSVHLSEALTPSVAAIPGVAAAAPRTVVQAADSFDLGEVAKLVAYPGDHTRFEAPPLARGRRVRRPDEAEVGVGMAEAFGVDVGSTLALQLESGSEVRFRVVGVDRALDNSGRIAYVQPDRLAGAGGSTTIAVRLRPGASEAAVRRRLTALGVAPERVGGATSSSAPFLGAVAALVRAIAAVDGVVCFFALVQALALAARERRSTLALLRALGAGRAAIARVFAGAALVLVVPSAILGLVLERLVLAPLVERLAAGYASLPLALTTAQAALVAGGLLALAAVAALWAAARSERESIVAGLRE